jgi:hypothetical protein
LKLPEPSESFDIQGFYYFEEGIKINVIPQKGPERELEYPIYPKGKQIPTAPWGCLKVPSHGTN